MLTHECRDAAVLSVVDPHDGGDDLVDEALGDAELQQGLGQGPPRHVQETRASQRTQQLLYRAEGIAMRLVLIDPDGGMGKRWGERVKRGERDN